MPYIDAKEARSLSEALLLLVMCCLLLMTEFFSFVRFTVWLRWLLLLLVRVNCYPKG